MVLSSACWKSFFFSLLLCNNRTKPILMGVDCTLLYRTVLFMVKPRESSYPRIEYMVQQWFQLQQNNAPGHLSSFRSNSILMKIATEVVLSTHTVTYFVNTFNWISMSVGSIFQYVINEWYHTNRNSGFSRRSFIISNCDRCFKRMFIFLSFIEYARRILLLLHA